MKLVVPDKKDKKVMITITDPPKVRKHMTEHFQEIFKGQNLDHNANMIANFLLEDDDPAPRNIFEEEFPIKLSWTKHFKTT